jgi:hypothetical protein
MSDTPSLDIIDQPIEKLRAYDNSARTHNRGQYQKVLALIRKSPSPGSATKSCAVSIESSAPMPWTGPRYPT